MHPQLANSPVFNIRAEAKRDEKDCENTFAVHAGECPFGVLKGLPEELRERLPISELEDML